MTAKRVVVAFAVAYSIAHFVYSGIVVPLRTTSVRQIAIEMRPLSAHLAGAPVVIDNPRQYGPTFFFVMDPILRFAAGNPVRLARTLYALELAALAAAWLLTLASLSVWFAHVRPDAPRDAFMWIALGVTLRRSWPVLAASAVLSAAGSGDTYGAYFRHA